MGAKRRRYTEEDIDEKKFLPNRNMLALLDGQMRGCGLNANVFLPETWYVPPGSSEKREFDKETCPNHYNVGM